MRVQKTKHNTHIRGLVIAVTMALCLFPGTSHAACIAGIPCVTGLTPNDPDAPTHPNTPPAPNAAKSGSPACDADFMNQIYANAYTEAERNITYSEVLIRKPDSVLEYSCFDQGAAVVANSVAPLFGESTFWAPSVWPNPNAGNIVINVSLGAAHADNWINALVLDSLKKITSIKTLPIPIMVERQPSLIPNFQQTLPELAQHAQTYTTSTSFQNVTLSLPMPRLCFFQTWQAWTRA